MKVLFIVNGLGFSSGMPIGGADKRALEIGRAWQKRGVVVAYLTTDAGEEILRKWGMTTGFFTVKRPRFWPKFLENNLLGRVLAYFYVIVADVFLVLANNQSPLTNNLVIYPTSDMVFDLLPSLFLKMKYRSAKLVGIVHHDIPTPWRRAGVFWGNCFLYATQRFGFLLLRLSVAGTFYPQTEEGENIKKTLLHWGFEEKSLFPFCNGVNLTEVNAATSLGKKYSACFLGGLRPSKGIFDLVPLWQKVREELPTATLLIIGGGLQQYEKDLRKRIEAAGLTEAVLLAGVIKQPQLYPLVKSCQIIISPSYEEGWGIAVLEGLSCGLPAVAYDLPAYRPFGQALVKVKLGDWRGLAKAVVLLLDDNKFYQGQISLGLAVAQEYDWGKIAEEELCFLRKLFDR